MPDGAWYDYLEGATRASGSYTLKPGELKVFTGSAVQAPTFEDIQKRDSQGIEQLLMNGNQQTTMKLLINGQVLILRGDKLYDMTGRRVE